MSVLGTGLTGLLAFQRALATTSHNIANAATEGYSRQRVEFATNNPQRLGPGYVGQGVQITGIRRLQDDWLEAQLRTSLSSNANATTRADFAERIDNLLADQNTGLAPTLENFFASVQDVASDPTGLPARMVMLNEAATLEGRFESINERLAEQRRLLNGQIGTAIEEINQYAKSIADLNKQIAARSTAGSPPNDLLDRRDTILGKLAEKVDLSVSAQDDGSVSVFIGNGQALVLGANASALTFSNLSGDPVNWDVGLRTTTSSNTQPINISRFLTGGEVGGLLETRTKLLDKAQNELGLTALNLATRFNEQNRLGLDLNGELGTDIFELPKVVVRSVIGNSVDAMPGVTIGDVSQLTPSDYRLRQTENGFQLIRLPENTTVPYELDANDPSVLIADGLRIDTKDIDAAVTGDAWLIQPTRFAATHLKMAMIDPAKLAASSGALAESRNTGDARPVALRMSETDPATPETYLPAAVVGNATGDGFVLLTPRYGTEAGSAKVESFRVLDTKNADLSTPVSVTFDAVKNQFVVGEERFALDPTGTTTIRANGWELKIQGKPSNGTGTVVDIQVDDFPVAMTTPPVTTITGPGWEMDIRGTPATGDLFTVELSKDRPGDNRNMLVMAGIQGERLIQGRTTLQGGYDTLLADVGTQTRRAQISRDASAALLESAQQQREALSGVNLDEEAANMLRFQQAYQAAAQIIATSNTMFDTLLNAVRR
ncbi:flagellar hook-associated protein FlgK [Thermochromatium tepidum]|uniref:Flagellar hook-associated protein 1 n=1 Tax=Thermochromatium tepidum ATCC 43061 TaxID=316276 RepID=A0A6I6DZF0_THETI|nr:flagellar hook-associated protein FlgK [Thermochromatium tepidum]QGU32994.1 flagellar hook-associated protein FlgK [Thermochromatium tepidum ATCC 43061]